MTPAVGPLLREVREVAKVLREEASPALAGPLLVTGMLAEQLAKELGRDAEPGAVVTGDAARIRGCSAVIRILAGDPGEEDVALVEEADRHGVPVVIVQLWAQDDWTKPFVLTPFVVECRPGQGFPVDEIARRIVEAVEDPVAVARRVPALEGRVVRSILGSTVVRAALLGTRGDSRPSRPAIALEQVRMLSELKALDTARGRQVELPVLAGIAGAVVGAGFLFREAARLARRALPEPVVDAGVAAAGTWAVGEAFRRLGHRLP